MKKNVKKIIIIGALLLAIILIVVGIIIVNKNQDNETVHYWKLTYIKNYDGVETSYKDNEPSREYLEKNSYKTKRLITDLKQVIVSSEEYYYLKDGKMYYSHKKVDKNNLKKLDYYEVKFKNNKMTIIAKIPGQGKIERQYKEVPKAEVLKVK